MPSLKRPDCDLNYELAGNGPPVVFIHGVGVAGEAWRPQIATLRNRFQTLIFDNRGLGKSAPCAGPITIEAMAGDTIALMDALGWETAHLVGHSMGGIIAQAVAHRNPMRVQSLSLLCTFVRGQEATRPTPGIIWKTIRTQIGTRSLRRRAGLELLWPLAELKKIDTDKLAARVSDLIGRDLSHYPPVVMRQMKALGAYDESGKLRALGSIPTLVVSADEDPIALPGYGRNLAATIPGARFELIKNASHGVTIHKADLINRMLGEFLESTVSRV